MSTGRPRIILDCDPGHDDALAIALAGATCELQGITTVAGNVPLELTTRNALVMRKLLGLKVEVHAGSAAPLHGKLKTAEFIHGRTGLDGPEHPSDPGEVDSQDAVGFMCRSAAAQPGEIWLVATGPLTNVARALQQDPTLAVNLAGISIMGGGIPWGNVTPAAEFNILVDPEAADIVFRSGVRLIMAGLHVTHQWRVGDKMIERLRALKSVPADFCADLINFYSQRYAEAFSGERAGPLHDPIALLALTHPELLESEALHVVVELTGTHTRGMTLADLRKVQRQAAPNVEVLMRIDAERASDVLLQAVASYR
jgi:inosine-uridine nucleoside N-ribohydrolase